MVFFTYISKMLTYIGEIFAPGKNLTYIGEIFAPGKNLTYIPDRMDVRFLDPDFFDLLC